jgi:anti-anti-sigma factor
MTPTVYAPEFRRIDYASAPAFEAQLLDAVGDATGAVVVDLGNAESISSIGLRALVLAAKRTRASGGAIAVAALRPLVREVFTISRFDAILPVFDEVSEAVAALCTHGAA